MLDPPFKIKFCFIEPRYSVNFSLDLMMIRCMSVLCVLLCAQIEEEFSLCHVGLMISFKFILCSLMHWRKEDGWFPRNLWVLQIILGGLGHYKPSAFSLMPDAPIL